MAFPLGFRLPHIDWSKPAQAPAKENPPSSVPAAPLAALPSPPQHRNRFALGMRAPAWLKFKRTAREKPAQPGKQNTVDSGYASSNRPDAGDAVLSSSRGKLSEASMRKQANARDFQTGLVELREALRQELDHYLSDPERQTLLPAKASGEIPAAQRHLYQAALSRIQEAFIRERESIEQDPDLSEDEKYAVLDKIGELFALEKKELKTLILQENAKHGLPSEQAAAIWKQGGEPLLVRKGERWLLEPAAFLGDGAFGSVRLLRSADGNRFAGKRCTLEPSSRQIDFLQNELDCFRQVYHKAGTHRNLVNAYGIASVKIDGTRQRMLLMDAISGLPGHEFFAKLSAYHRSGKITSQEYFGALQFLLSRVLEATAHINKAGVAHADIKPENFVVCRNALEPKVIDMGLAQQHGSRTSAGTPGYAAWDNHRQEGITEKSDVYSIAAMTVEAIEGYLKGRVDPASGRWKLVEPSEGARKATYLVPAPGNGDPENAANMQTVDGKNYVKVRANMVFTSYTDFVNKQLLSIEPHSGNIMPSGPAQRNTAAQAMQHPFLSHRVLEDETREKAVIAKVFDLVAQEATASADKAPQLPRLRFPTTSLETSIEGALHLRMRPGLLASLTADRSWLKALAALHREPVRSGIARYDRTGDGQTDEPERNKARERDERFMEMERQKINDYFPGKALNDAIEDIREYVREASLALEALNAVPSAGEPAHPASDIALIAERAEIAKDFLRRYERSIRIGRIDVVSTGDKLKPAVRRHKIRQ